jgi:4-aminobutyrate aminotransferase/(S)-3-amino-2-methylpropionate transaminase
VAGTASATDEPPLVIAPPPGPRSREVGARLAALECPAFEERRKARSAVAGADDAHGIVLARGRGSNLFDVDDNRYVDLAAGFGAAILGHGPSAAHDAARAQLDVLAQGLGDLYASDVKARLLERLAAIYPAPGARVLFGQSGADALTAAIKTVTLATGRSGLIAFDGAYHGLSYAPLAACGLKESFRAPFAEQLNRDVTFVPYPRDAAQAAAIVERIGALLDEAPKAAVLVEPVLGRGGVVPAPAGFLAALGEVARRSGALVIADEIWTGCGRSGALVRSLDEGLVPDAICLGKGLGASLPISACIGSAEVMGAWARGGEVVHTSTHAGAPLACAAALAALDAVDGGLARRAAALGAQLVHALKAALGGLAVEVRGLGLLVGVELHSPAAGISACRALLARGYVVTLGGRGEVLVITPPLTIDEGVLMGFPSALAAVLVEAT